jgi:hypothetical protein
MSNTINLHFVHPTDGRELNVRVDDTMTAAEAVNELISANFVPPNPQGYKLAVKGGAEINHGQTFQAAGVPTESRIRVIAATDAGLGNA